MDDAPFQLSSQLHHISENLGSEELGAMKFLCRDLLHSNRLNQANSGLKLFSALQEKGLLEVTDTFIVAELLYRTKQFKLLKGMKYDRWEVSKLLKDPDKARVSSYRQLLFDVSEEITMKDLETVKHFLHNNLSKYKLESMTTMLDVFVEMEKEGLLEETNLELLKRICKELGEPLAKMFDRYTSSMVAPCAPGGTGKRPDEEPVIHLTRTPQTILPSGKLVSRGSQPAEQPRALKSHDPLSVEFSRICGLKEQDGNGLHGPSIETNSGQSLGSYRMESIPRGSCVIINNCKFKTMGERRGTQVDADRLDKVFRWLGFEVTLYKNLTAEEMENTMLCFQQMDHTAHDCFVCCILTHGEKGVMCGTDGKQVAIAEITSFFSGTKCPSLREKPKLFFIQACQGRKKQDCVEIEIPPPSTGIRSPSAGIRSPSAGIRSPSAGIRSPSAGIRSPSAGIRSPSAGIQSPSSGIQPPSGGMESGSGLEEDAVCSSATIPDEADFLLGMATVEGYVSYRHIQEGAWYIQSLCENLEKYCGSEDLLSILTIVNRDVSGKKDKQDKTQMPQPRYTLRKKLYFPVTQSFGSFNSS